MKAAKVATKALARSYRAERLLTGTIGLIALFAGIAALALGRGLFGPSRAERRPLLDTAALDWLTARPIIGNIAVIAASLLLLVLGLWWALRTIRPERRPDLGLERQIGRQLTVTTRALSDALQADAETITGVTKARARTVGKANSPALRLHLSLRDGADLNTVWQELDTKVLRRARESLDLQTLPTAVRLELDTGKRQRVR